MPTATLTRRVQAAPPGTGNPVMQALLDVLTNDPRAVPELLAAFFGRLHAPDILLGMHTVDEVEDIQGTEIAQKWTPQGAPVAVQRTAPVAAALPATQAEQDPQRDEYDRLLGAYPWSDAQRAQLATRWGQGDMHARETLLAGMRRQVEGPRAPAPAAPATAAVESATEEQVKLATKLLASRVWTAEEREGWAKVMHTASKAQATGHIDAIKAELERRKAARKAASAEEAELTLDTAMDYVLPGDATKWDGHGGKALKTVPPSALRAMAKWIDADEDRKANYERLRGAIHLVLEQWAKETASDEAAPAAAPAPAPSARPEDDPLFSPDGDGLPW